jgi:hypothetical protein
MKYCSSLSSLGLAAAVVVAGSIAIAQPGGKDKAPKAPAGQPEMQLPPGMTMEDMKAYMEAGTTGPMHERMKEDVGTWTGTTTMWMSPDAPPTKTDCKAVFTTMMDGKFLKMELTGDTPMGPMSGMGIYGFDNVSKKFQSTWIDNTMTGMMQGTGELSSDKSTITWNYSFNCPIMKKAMVMREIDRRVDANTTIIEMHGPDPKTGKEYKMMEVTMKRTGTHDTKPAK